ncbi:HAD family hydrolase [Curtobacterium sp. MCBD17_034]|uniref:HAD family hydrolase n=1 Tax=unclassified Curtobacterium TaxID=257496 RepID=UPI000DA976DB|nr:MULTISPECIES: HAD family hydrolase [unclassified Curtobacterium]PZF61010.1 HAD family hydrolase [Curtobacterium sp. MCBD17_034]PZF66262.1 HAD family hydrolase [Curtobacterium sp. MCBD17_013]PZM40360.1 HAD family hydrolase [Curtobacterium sp. MCBD17_031]
MHDSTTSGSTDPEPSADSVAGTIVLWDVDGTLVENAAVPGSLYHLALERTVGRDLEQLVGHQHGRTDAGIILEALRAHGLDPELSETVRGHLQRLSEERYRSGERRTPAPGVMALLQRMTDRGWRSALLTGNSAGRARLKLTSAGFDPDAFDWAHSYFGDEDVERQALTRRAAADLRGNRVVVIGDTPRDGTAADAAGIPFIAVATGVHDVDELGRTSAVAVVADCAEGADTLLDAVAALRPLV